MLLKQLKAIHWAAIGQALIVALFVGLAKDPSLATYAPVFHTLAVFFGASSLGTAFQSPKLGTGAAFVLAGALGLGSTACGASTASTIAQFAPIVANGLCQLAADQGSAEPGWEVWVCDVVDPSSGQPTGRSVEIHVPKGAGVVSRGGRVAAGHR